MMKACYVCGSKVSRFEAASAKKAATKKFEALVKKYNIGSTGSDNEFYEDGTAVICTKCIEGGNK